MTRHSVEGIIEPQPLVHHLNGPPKNIDISPGIVTAEVGLLQAEAAFDQIKGVAGSSGFTE